MQNPHNKQLYDIANRSMLTHVGAMLYICDENFIVCMKSAGAQRVTPHLIIGSDLKKSLDQSFVEALTESPKITQTLLLIHESMLDAIIIPDEIDGIKYFAVYCEADRIPSCEEYFSKNGNKGLEMIAEHIANEIKRLLSAQNDNLCSLTVSLRSLIAGRRIVGVFAGDEARRRAEFGKDRVSIYRVSYTIKDELSKHLPKHSLDITYHGLEAYCDNASFKSLASFIGTVVFNCYAICDTKAAWIDIEAPRDDRVTVHFTTEASKKMLEFADKLDGTESDAVKLLEKYSPFAFEYTICREFARQHGWNTELYIRDGRFELSVEFSIHKVKYIPYVRGHNQSYITNMVASYSQRLEADSE